MRFFCWCFWGGGGRRGDLFYGHDFVDHLNPSEPLCSRRSEMWYGMYQWPRFVEYLLGSGSGSGSGSDGGSGGGSGGGRGHPGGGSSGSSCSGGGSGDSGDSGDSGNSGSGSSTGGSSSGSSRGSSTGVVLSPRALRIIVVATLPSTI